MGTVIVFLRKYLSSIKCDNQASFMPAMYVETEQTSRVSVVTKTWNDLQPPKNT